jgi:hypothetical protein
VFNILSHKGNANQSDTDIPSHPCENGNHPEKKSVDKDVRKSKAYTLLLGM